VYRIRSFLRAPYKKLRRTNDCNLFRASHRRVRSSK
jgi:hypothetical protein